jgi:hypothetical protein
MEKIASPIGLFGYKRSAFGNGGLRGGTRVGVTHEIDDGDDK